jgi:hypothetical protein
MGILVDTIVRVERLTLRPANEHLAPEALAPEELLVGILDTHPVRGCPTLVPFREGEPLLLLLVAEFLLMPSDTTEEANLDEPAVDGARGDIKAELALDAPWCGELNPLCCLHDSSVLPRCGLALPTAARLILQTRMRQPVAHGAHVARNALSNVTLVVTLLVQYGDGDSLVVAEVAEGMRVVVEQRRSRRGHGRGRSGGSRCGGRVATR